MGLAPVLAVGSAVARPSWSSLLGNWHPDMLFLVVIVIGVLYGAAVRRLAARGRRWPVGRSAAFASGLAIVLFATQSGFAQYDTIRFSLHVAQHLLLGMVAPLLLVLGAPITLLLQSSDRAARTRTLRILHSRTLAWLTHPILVWVVFGGTLVVLYFTGLYALSLRNGWVHVLVHAHFVVVGCLFMAYVIGVDPLPRSFGYGGRMLFVAVVLPFHAFLGVALLGRTRVLAAGWYAQVAPAWATHPLRDQQLGAGMLWAFGELFGLVALGIVLYQWMRHDELVAARADRSAALGKSRPTPT
ncbi:MAG: cytochrome c oxidase assembly protein [Acidimicrobiia bacterium]